MTVGVPVGIGVGVEVGTGAGVWVAVGSGVGVEVGTGVGIWVAVGTGVEVGDGASVGVGPAPAQAATSKAAKANRATTTSPLTCFPPSLAEAGDQSTARIHAIILRVWRGVNAILVPLGYNGAGVH